MKKIYYAQPFFLRGYLSVIIFYLILTSKLLAQVTSSTFDSTWAAQFQGDIDEGIATGLLKGVSVSLYVPNQGRFIGVGGESSDGIPITSDMQFCIGSNTKLFTSVVILKLQELGFLSIDDHLYEWLPKYPFIDSSATIRQLLMHQTGFYDYFNDISLEEYDSIVYGPGIIYTTDDILATLGPPHFPPGEGYRYSNTNYVLAGMIIEAATGKSYAENLHQYIFDPLDMDSTFLGIDEVPNGNVADGWYFGDDISNVPLNAPVSMAWAAGAIYSTAQEMSEWYQHLWAGDIISQPSLDQLTDIEPGSWYGMGITFNYFPLIPETPSYVHFGELTGYFSVMGYDITTGTVICELTNHVDFTNAFFNVLFPLLSTLYYNYPRQPDDAGIIRIIEPSSNSCNLEISPKLILQNFGQNDLTSVVINIKLDSALVQAYNWSGNLGTDSTEEILLPVINTSEGKHQLNIFTSNPNGKAEGYTYNDSRQTNIVIHGNSTLFLIDEGFEGTEFPPQGWLNGNGTFFDWGKSKLSLLDGQGCAAKNNYDDGTYRAYDLELPATDISALENPVLSYYYAYSYFPGGYDSLAVLISTDCGDTYQALYYKGGDDLVTTFPIADRFYPADDQWKQVNLDLSGYDGEVWIKFRDICGFSNFLFMDDVKVGEGCSTPYDLSVTDLTTTTANLHWNYGGQANEFEVYFRVSGSLPWSQWSHLTIAGNMDSIVIHDLLPDTEYDWYVTAGCGLGTSPEPEYISFTTETVTDVIDDLSESSLKLFPNPASSITTLQFNSEKPGTIQIRMMDLTGAIVFDIKLWNSIRTLTQKINLGNYTPGIYFIELRTENQLYVQKLLVQKM